MARTYIQEVVNYDETDYLPSMDSLPTLKNDFSTFDYDAMNAAGVTKIRYIYPWQYSPKAFISFD